MPLTVMRADTCRSHWCSCLVCHYRICHLILFQTDCMTLCEVICITKYCHDQISSPHYPIENNLSSEVSFCSGSSACCVHSGLGGAGLWWCWAGINHAQAALHQHGHQPATQYSGTNGLWSCICDQIINYSVVTWSTYTPCRVLPKSVLCFTAHCANLIKFRRCGLK